MDNESNLTLHGLQQYYVKLNENEKNHQLMNLIDGLDFNQIIIFVRSIQRCETLLQLLIEQNVPALTIHSGMPQEERLKRYEQFKSFQKRILVSTNLFGRGMDVERVNIVINYDMCAESDTYLHRVARAGRFDTKGLAISFISEKTEADTLNSIQQRFSVDIRELSSNTEIKF